MGFLRFERCGDIVNIKATDQCQNCGADFADHRYVPDSITQYDCPHPQQECGYGFFTGGDPRKFHPDAESCTEAEIENHRRACELWNEAESHGKTPEPEECPSGWICDESGKPVVHVLRAPYGLGVYTVEWQTQFKPRENDEPDSDEAENI